MEVNSVFIGVVSHLDSKYLSSHGATGLASRLAQAWENQGVRSTVQVNTSNYFDEQEPFALTAFMARDSVKEEIRLERLWFRYLARSGIIAFNFRIWARWIRYFSRWRSNSHTAELRRLLNIEFSHLDLYRNAIESRSDWTVILEDDAFVADEQNFAANVLRVFNHSNNVKMINLSMSFSLSEIGVEPLLTPMSDIPWMGKSEVLICSSARPATNTVCAIAFKTTFLQMIMIDFSSQPPGPVVPIDWKLNGSLMRLWDTGVIQTDECWFVEPGPVLQLSMHLNPASE